MISFYPGPSRLYSSIPVYMQEACQKGVLSINHRSPEFVEIMRKTVSLLKQKLEIPDNYTVFFVSSATECWEIIAQSLVSTQSYHLYNGAFGEKWMESTAKLKKRAGGKEFGVDELPEPDKFPVPAGSSLIALTHNETSNATTLPDQSLQAYRSRYPDKLIAIDATSSMAGVCLPFAEADIWFASVQKCFGLPAGMALMICSPKAISVAMEINDRSYYNSMTAMIERMKDFQTTHTPNVLVIYLMMKVMEQIPNIIETDQNTRLKAKKWYDFLGKTLALELLVKNPSVRSDTVIAVKGNEQLINNVKKEAKAAGLLLGNGYGNWKANTFRIANFPAIEPGEIEKLEQFLSTFSFKF